MVDAMILAPESVEVLVLCASSINEVVEIAITKSARSKILKWNIGVMTFWSSQITEGYLRPLTRKRRDLTAAISPSEDDSHIRTVSYSLIRFAI
jgi:hypothetical protein